jgi:hypothetical protein
MTFEEQMANCNRCHADDESGSSAAGPHQLHTKVRRTSFSQSNEAAPCYRPSAESLCRRLFGYHPQPLPKQYTCVVARHPIYASFLYHLSAEYQSFASRHQLQIAPRFSSWAAWLGASCEAAIAPITTTTTTPMSIAARIMISSVKLLSDHSDVISQSVSSFAVDQPKVASRRAERVKHASVKL